MWDHGARLRRGESPVLCFYVRFIRRNILNNFFRDLYDVFDVT